MRSGKSIPWTEYEKWDKFEGGDTMPITPAEFEDKMKEIINDNSIDQELKHTAADDLMMEVLKSLGYEKGVQYFDAMEKWYA